MSDEDMNDINDDLVKVYNGVDENNVKTSDMDRSKTVTQETDVQCVFLIFYIFFIGFLIVN